MQQGDERNKPVTFDGFPLGVDNRSPETRLPDGALRQGDNAMIDKSGHARRAFGYTLVDTLTNCHSLWSCQDIDFALLVDDSKLKSFDGTTVTDTGYAVHPHEPMEYTALNGKVYFSNGIETGVYYNGSVSQWGMTVPASPTLAVTAYGGMHKGGYFVTTTTVKTDGEESGASLPTYLEIAANQGIAVTGISNPDSEAYTRVYVTQANGSDFSEVVELASGTASYDIGSHAKGQELKTLHSRPPYAGKIVGRFNGRLYVGNEKTLWYTEVHRPNLIFPQRNFYFFEQSLEGFAERTDGIFVFTKQRTFWLAGADPADVRLVVASQYGGVRGSVTYVPGDWFSSDHGTTGVVPCWRDSTGALAVGRANGFIQRVGDDRINLGQYSQGRQLPFSADGLQQVIASLWKRDGDIVSGSFGDTVTAEVVSNGLS